MWHPRGIVGNLLHRFAIVAFVPGVHDLVEVVGLAQPTTLHDMMTYARGNQIVLIGIGSRHKKLGHGIAHGSESDVLAECPPTVIPHLFELFLRTVEQRYVIGHPLPCLAVGYLLYDVLVLHIIEIIHIVLVVGIA